MMLCYVGMGFQVALLKTNAEAFKVYRSNVKTHPASRQGLATNKSLHKDSRGAVATGMGFKHVHTLLMV